MIPAEERMVARLSAVKTLLDSRVHELTFEQLVLLVRGEKWDFVAFLLEKCPDLCGLPDAELQAMYQAFCQTLRHRITAIPVPHDWRVGTV